MPGSGLDNMVDRKQYEDLARLYTLFQLVPTGISTLKKALKDSIAERGKLVNEAEGPSGDVDGLLVPVKQEVDVEGVDVDGRHVARGRCA